MTVLTKLNIGAFRLEQTCAACPEQYDVFLLGEEQQVAYFRLRHGHFSAQVPDCGGETVYEACPDGDGLFSREERPRYLRAALTAVEDWLINKRFNLEWEEAGWPAETNEQPQG